MRYHGSKFGEVIYTVTIYTIGSVMSQIHTSSDTSYELLNDYVFRQAYDPEKRLGNGILP